MYYPAIFALAQLLAVAAAVVLAVAGIVLLARSRRRPRRRAKTFRSFAEAAAEGALDVAESEAARVLSRNDRRG